jgi:hypothetical protein
MASDRKESLLGKIREAADEESWSSLNIHFLETGANQGMFYTDRILVTDKEIFYESKPIEEYREILRDSKKKLSEYFQRAKRLGMIRDENMKAHYELYTGKKF